jgi:hypothetical protein|tara:strand:- start:521 stop:949 length:429 start_codon:yes stop_codon:yes gene_type:complete
MANIIPFAFRGELFSGTHNFATSGDSFKIALYTSVGSYTTSSTVYLTASEVSASNTGYTAGGQVLNSQAVASGTAVASVDFADSVINSATFGASHAAIYNDSKSDKLCVVLDFNGTKTATNGTFTISFPNPSTPADAIISMA